MAIDADQHPLTKTQHTAAFAVIALFWGIGVTLIDQRPEIGVSLSLLGIAATVWMYGRDFFKIKGASAIELPWIGLTLISIEIVIPMYMFIINGGNSMNASAKIHNSDKYISVNNLENYTAMDVTSAINNINSNNNTNNADCKPGTFACIRASGGGVVDGVHFYDTKSCSSGPFLDIKGDGGIINNITSDRYTNSCKEGNKIENQGTPIKGGAKK